jgi:hypothetical protein
MLSVSPIAADEGQLVHDSRVYGCRSESQATGVCSGVTDPTARRRSARQARSRQPHLADFTYTVRGEVTDGSAPPARAKRRRDRYRAPTITAADDQSVKARAGWEAKFTDPGFQAGAGTMETFATTTGAMVRTRRHGRGARTEGHGRHKDKDADAGSVPERTRTSKQAATR